MSTYSGGEIQTRCVEQWLNDILKDAEEVDTPDFIKRPVHKIPLKRYEIDRIIVEKMDVG
jgi:hypothetical protein